MQDPQIQTQHPATDDDELTRLIDERVAKALAEAGLV